MEETQEEKIQRLVKEEIEKSEKERTQKENVEKRRKFIINGIILFLLIATFIYVALNPSLFTSFDEQYQQVEKVSYNTGDVIKIDNGTTFQIDTTKDYNGTYNNFVVNNIVRTVYLYNGEKYEEYKTHITVSDCSFCEDFGNITEEGLLKRFIKTNPYTDFNKIVITEQREGYIYFELHWTGKDNAGTAFIRTQFSTYVAGNHKLLSTPTPSVTRIGNMSVNETGREKTLKIVPEQNTLRICIDNYTAKSRVLPQTLMAAGGAPFERYTWKALSGLPLGTIISSNGVFSSSGGALAQDLSGEKIVKVEVSDGTSTATENIILYVQKVSSEREGAFTIVCPFPVLSQYPGESFALPDANVNKPYGASLFAMGGSPSLSGYIWREDTSYSERSDFDASGLTIDWNAGIVRGTPRTSGKTLKFRVIVKDSAGDTAVNNPVYTINVKP